MQQNSPLRDLGWFAAAFLLVGGAMLATWSGIMLFVGWAIR